jgi:voltage-gated potassium channel
MIRRLFTAFSVLLAVFGVGVIGYVVLEHWPIFDSVYMTAITMGGVGYREIHPLHVAGQLWTMLVIFGGVGAFGFAIITVTDFMVEGHFAGLLEGRGMRRHIDALNGHQIVAGLGRVGLVVAEELERHGREFVVIDVDDEALARARARGWAAVKGDATEENTLKEAGVERAAGLIAALDSDAENVFVTLTARGLAPNAVIVARATSPSAESKLLRSGADRVITPTEIGGRRMAAMVTRPDVVDYLDVVGGGTGLDLKLEQIALSEGDPYVGVTIGGAHIRSATGAYVLAVRHGDGTVDRNPDPALVMSAGDVLVILGSEEQLRAVAGRGCADANVCYPRQR